MSKAIELIEAAKEAAGLRSDNALATEIGVPRQTISEIKRGKHAPSAYIVMRLATMAGVDPLQAIADLETEREKDPVRVRWLENFRTAACVAASVLVTMLVTTPEKAYAESIDTEAQSPVIQIIAVLLRRLRNAWSRLAGIATSAPLRQNCPGW